ncbi:MAG: HNH endonuclease [Nocardioidaceae bacterium]|nr:HNH endonuclease [Nocardioidaceae bacterium]
MVSEFCLYELAPALGLTPEGGRYLVAHALELFHRLPRLWERVQSGSLPAWRARRVADKTIALSPEAAGFVDAQVAQYAPRIGNAALDRLVEEAIARHMPEMAAEVAEQAAEGRHITINHQQVSFAGTSLLQGELDLPDALDLDKVLQAGAEQQMALGSTESLDVRRALALGALARGEQFLGLATPDTERVETPRRITRQIVLYVHLSDRAIGNPHGIGRVESPNILLTAAQVAAWCGLPDSQVIVRPVIDLNNRVSVESYEIPDRLREQVILRDLGCVAPYCTKRARRADIDHVREWIVGGSTGDLNLAPLCRGHHRLKTFSAWTYTMLQPGSYLWRSPLGQVYFRDGTGTRDLTPRPVDPPGG